MHKHFATFIIILLGCIWGSSYILIFKALEAFNPIEVAGFRMTIAGIVLLPWVIKYVFFSKNLKSFDDKTQPFSLKRMDYINLCISGIIGVGIPTYLFSIAGKFIPSGLSGIITALTPIFTIIIGALFYKEKITRKGAIGVMFGLLGVLVIFTPSLLETTKVPFVPTFLALIATMMYGFNINLIKYKFNHLAPMVKTSFPLVFVAIIYVIILINSNAWEVFSTNPHKAWISFGYVFLLGFFGSAVSMILFNIIIKKTSALAASTNTFIIPLVAVFLGVLNNEDFTWNLITGLALIIVSLVVIIRPSKRTIINLRP